MQIDMNREGLGIRIHWGGKRLTVHLKGGLDTRTAPELENELQPMLTGTREFVLDLSELDYITSAGLRFLLKAAKSIGKDGAMTVENPNSEVREVFSISGFDRLLTILPEISDDEKEESSC